MVEDTNLSLQKLLLPYTGLLKRSLECFQIGWPMRPEHDFFCAESLDSSKPGRCRGMLDCASRQRKHLRNWRITKNVGKCSRWRLCKVEVHIKLEHMQEMVQGGQQSWSYSKHFTKASTLPLITKKLKGSTA